MPPFGVRAGTRRLGSRPRATMRAAAYQSMVEGPMLGPYRAGLAADPRNRRRRRWRGRSSDRWRRRRRGWGRKQPSQARDHVVRAVLRLVFDPAQRCEGWIGRREIAVIEIEGQ